MPNLALPGNGPLQRPGESFKLHHAARSSGVHIVGTRGSGKSTLISLLALNDFVRGTPTVVFELQGGLTDQILWRLLHIQDTEQQLALLRKIVYVDLSGESGSIAGWPLLYRQGSESLFKVAERFVQLAERLDPEMANAPILGKGAFEEVGIYTGMALFAMGYQLTEALDLLTHPEWFTTRLRQAAAEHPEAQQAVSYFLEEYPRLKDDERRNRILTYRNKLFRFTLDPVLKAMFGSARADVQWDQVAEQGAMVILDFKDILSDEDKRFKLRWCFTNLWHFIRSRKFARETPISLFLDELSYLLSLRASSDDVLSAELDNFINTDMRYRNIWLTAAHQEMYQIPEKMRNTLLSMGTQIIGATSDKESAEGLARQYLEYDPFWVRKRVPVWMSDLRGPYKVDYTTDEYSLDEQREQLSRLFLTIPKLHFLVAHSGVEGALPTTLQRANIEQLVRRVDYPDQRQVERARQILIRRSGRPLQDILAEVEQRRTYHHEAVETPKPRASVPGPTPRSVHTTPNITPPDPSRMPSRTVVRRKTASGPER